MDETTNICWDDIEPAARKMLHVWRYKPDLEWAKEAWGHLRMAGLTRSETILEKTAAKIRFVALARIYIGFGALAWGEDIEYPVNDLAENLEIDPTALGILVPPGKTSEFDYADGNYDLREAALIEITDSQRKEIFRCLKAVYGGAELLYSRLWHIRNPTKPLAVDGDDTDGDEFEVTQENSEAYSFVVNGFKEG